MRYFYTIFFIILSFNAFSQPSIQLSKSLGGSGIDELVKIRQKPDGNYIALCNTASTDGDLISFPDRASDIWLLELDHNFNIVWKKSLGGTGLDRGFNINLEADGYTIIGKTDSEDYDLLGRNSTSSLWFFKTDLSGNILWQFDCPDQIDYFAAYLSFIKTTDNGYLITTLSSANENIIYKLNSLGGIVWREVRPAGGKSFNVIFEKDNYYEFLGRGDAWSSEFAVSKIDKDGSNYELIKLLGIYGDYAINAIKTNDNGYLIGGDVYHFLYAMKFDSDWNLVWTSNIRSDQSQPITELTETDNGYYGIGTAMGNKYDVVGKKSLPGDIILFRLDKVTGKIIWFKCFGGSGHDGLGELYFMSSNFGLSGSLFFDNNNQLVFGGQSGSTDGDVVDSKITPQFPNKSDAWIVRLNQEENISQKIFSITSNACVGQKIKIKTSPGYIQTTDQIKVRLSDLSGDFTNYLEIVPDNILSDSIVFTIPNTVSTGGYGYKVKIENITSNILSLASNAFIINTIPSGTIDGPLEVVQSEELKIKINLNGGGPFAFNIPKVNLAYYELNTEAFTTSVKPERPVYLKISNLTNSCGIASIEDSTWVSMKYCEYNYVNADDCNSNFRLTTVVMNDEQNQIIINNVQSKCHPDNYNTFNKYVLNKTLTPGGLYKVVFKINENFISYFGEPYFFSIHLDKNQDKAFTSDEILYFSENKYPKNQDSISIEIPVDALAGQTRLRIKATMRGDYNSKFPCTKYRASETEDYIVNVGSRPASSLNIIGNNFIFCSGSNVKVKIAVTGEPISNPVYKVLLSNKHGQFVNEHELNAVLLNDSLSFNLPVSAIYSELYKFRVKMVNSVFATVSKGAIIRNVPSAKFLTSDEIVRSGTNASFQISFTGGQPYNFKLSVYETDRTSLGDNYLGDLYLTQNFGFSLNKVSNTCGTTLLNQDVKYFVKDNNCNSNGDPYGYIEDFKIYNKSSKLLLKSKVNPINIRSYYWEREVANLTQKDTVIFWIKAGQASSLFHFGIWIDKNKDSLFTSPELLYASDVPLNATTSFSDTLVLPEIEGPSILRVRTVNFFNGPITGDCQDYFFEGEDYNINLLNRCEPILNLNGVETKGLIKQASDKIISSQRINSSSQTIYNSKNSVTLSPGFEVEKGTVFKTDNTGCL